MICHRKKKRREGGKANFEPAILIPPFAMPMPFLAVTSIDGRHILRLKGFRRRVCQRRNARENIMKMCSPATEMKDIGYIASKVLFR